MVEANPYKHQHYTHVKDEKDADGIAWTFINKDEFVKFPFKFEELKDDEFRANIIYTGLCHSDVLTGRSQWGPANYPIAPGHEIVGIVSKIGKDVTNIKVGDRIAFGTIRNSCNTCKACSAGHDQLCLDLPFPNRGTFGEYWGGYSSALQQPARYAYKIPENLPSDRTPPLLCAGVTVYAPLAKFCKPGDKVAVLGIGGLGHLAVAYANKLGCHVTALTSTPGKEEFIKKFGAHEVRSSSDPEDLRKMASEFNVIINTLSTANQKMFGLYLDLTAPEGTFIQVGAPPADEPFQIHAFQILMKNIRIAGSAVGSRKETQEMLDFSAKHNILPLCEHFGFEDFPKALDKLENGKPMFRCVVNVEEWAKKNGFFKEYK
eukprot:CAMPEP_0176436836 /NCGR_PEP_ID=MMETSP0127-20121128/18228_1 /TAXON_ID=938130 /ORGANISM="Platyophrya macrostoma, Strain WH" /LENGTH=374 /DNA_ID=CAMNT_0017820277 /DNA_START=38 /DNA_END=1162 /DNA_ORIENTATION=+